MADERKLSDHPAAGAQAALGKVEVLPPDQTKQLEQIQAIIGSLAGPYLDTVRQTQEHETSRLRSQLRYQLVHQIIGACVVVLALLIAAFFAWNGLAGNRYEFAERIVATM
jgi:hypothetical protein